MRPVVLFERASIAAPAFERSTQSVMRLSVIWPFGHRSLKADHSTIQGSVANRSEEARLRACEVEWLRRSSARGLS